MFSRSNSLRILSVGLALCLAPAALTAQSYVAPDVDERMEKLEAKIEALRAEIAALEQELSNARTVTPRALERLDRGSVRIRGERAQRPTRIRAVRPVAPRAAEPRRERTRSTRIERTQERRNGVDVHSDIRMWINGEEVDPQEGLDLSAQVRALIGEGQIDLTDGELSGLEDHLRLFHSPHDSDDSGQIRRRTVIRRGDRADRSTQRSFTEPQRIQRRTRIVSPEGSTIWQTEELRAPCPECGHTPQAQPRERRRTTAPRGTFFLAPHGGQGRIELQLEAEIDACEPEQKQIEPFGLLPRLIDGTENGAVRVIQRLPQPNGGAVEHIELRVAEEAPQGTKKKKAKTKNPNFL